ncbi:M57 family metalloprotease [Archangium lansingense]|uniref:M57 family metalloprotease n=1 Tax=Archangium lansingense TaxID=2995310 RepID=A0ABT3ZWD5_9BACT|nr:M57 family metalloprotease [Archangium lansinium]MCY1073709.1 M57 family metalloprotease [Archangium lansinium]
MRKLSMALLAGVALVGCGGPEASETRIPSFEEFKASAINDEGNVYVVNGDEAVEGVEGLQAYYDNFVANGDVGATQDGLAVYYIGGDIKWSSTQKMNLTYCISSSSFGTRYSTMVSAMNSATAAWEATASVNFVHSTTYDSNCTASQAGVLFDVRMVSGQSYLARAFFPNSSRSARNVLVDSSSFGSISPWTLTGILRHELGHVLGFRHEHTRSSASGCYEDSQWRALTTTYDRSSVMHYPQCNGTQTGDLVLTTLDKQGARALYP